MKTIRTLTPFLVLVLLTLLAGCGNKGDLVRPAPEPAAPAAG